MFFEIFHKDNLSQARTGLIHTAHGDIETPIFMPVGTQATVKSLDSNDLENLNAQIILGNTYHLHLRPGENLINDFGGLHKFMNWDRPILTDSGGFQVFSLQNFTTSSLNHEELSKNNQGKLVKIDDDGVTFRSHIDGSEHRFTPESSIDIQHKLGADIIMAFDECTPDDASENYTKEAMERTHAWAVKSLNHHKTLQLASLTKGKQYLFGIIQGARHKHLREESAKFISSLDFDGIAIGGESVGYNMEATKQILDWINPHIPKEKPHYTMGVGSSPLDLFEVVERGVDMFDCVTPTRTARNGSLYIKTVLPPGRGESEGGSSSRNKHTINITNAQFKNDKFPIDQTCACSTCQHYSRAYIHHLFDARELLGYRLATIHNVHFMLNLMTKIRDAINQDRFLELKKEWEV